MIYKATKQITDNYFAHKGISQSQIKLYLKGFDFYLQNIDKQESEKYFDEPKDYFIIGSAVDMMLTHDESEFADTYYISTLEEKPSDAEISIIRMVKDMISQHNFINSSDEFISYGELMEHETLLNTAFILQNYRSNWGLPAKLKVFNTDICSQYWHELLLAGTKQVITSNDKLLIDSLVERFKTSPLTKKYFESSDNHIDIIYQVPIYASKDGVILKGLVDILYINHSEQSITLVDIKTMNNSAITFPSDYRKRNYDFQAAYYTSITNLSNVVFEFDLRYTKTNKYYTITDFEFLVASKEFPMSDALSFSTGLDNLKDLIYGKPVTYTHTVSQGGDFYSYPIKEIMSVTDIAIQLHSSIVEGEDIRLHDGKLLLYSL